MEDLDNGFPAVAGIVAAVCVDKMVFSKFASRRERFPSRFLRVNFDVL